MPRRNKNFGLWYEVCTVSGYLLSYWNRSFFPDMCGDYQLNDPVRYDTMVRMGASYNDVADVFKLVAEQYGWRHIVLISDDDVSSVCWYTAKPFSDLFSNDENYTFTWLRLADDPTDKEFHDILQQTRARTRGQSLFVC